MKKILYAVAGLALLASCSTEEIVELGNQSAITFAEAYVENATRAIDGSYTMNNLESFKVYGTLTTDEGQGDVVNIFPGVPVTKSGDDEWTYTHATQYWIEGNDYMFRAIAGQNINVWADINTGMANKIEVANIADVNDILFAEENVAFREGMTPETVGFTFSHLLSKVKFTVRVKDTANNYTYRVRDIAIDDTNVAGTYDIETKTWGDTTTNALAFGDAVAVGTTDASAEAIQIASGAAAESLYERQVIPATYTDMAISFQLEVLHGNTVVSSKDIEHKVNGNTVLQAGNAYNFVLEFGAPGDDIEFTVNDIKPWVDNTVVSTASALQAAINAAANGATITLTGDITLEQTLTIPAGKNITLDLAGYTMSQEMTCTSGHAMLCNHGTLTITGEGTMTFKDNGVGGEDIYATYVLDNRGTLTVENGTFTNLSEQLGHTNYAINASHSSQLITINGGIISAPYARSVRVNYGALVVNGGNFTGQVWGQPSAEGTSITITGGSFAPVYTYDGSSVFIGNSEKDVTLSITGGYFATRVGCNDATKAGVVGAIKGGTFTEAAKTEGATAALVADGYKFVKSTFNNKYYVFANDVVAGNEVDAIVAEQSEVAAALADSAVKTIVLSEGEFTLDNYSGSSAKDTLRIIGNGTTKVAFANLQMRAELYNEFTIENCEILRMPNKSWGMLVFSSSNNANGVYTIKNCTFNGQGTQGIFINETVSGATYNIVDCTFNGDFGSEGAITIQNNADVAHIVNVDGCTFNNIPATSHKIYAIGDYEGWTLTGSNVGDIYWGHSNPNI